jgi:hypothetical protein
MSFTYRPTPVIVLSGKTVGDDHVPLRRLPAGTMQGYTPNMASQALNSIGRRTISGDPWIIASGTMGRFVLGDDTLPADFFDSLNLPPVVPDVAPALPPDFFSAAGTPILPTPNLPPLGPAPSLGIPDMPGAGTGVPFINTPGPAAPTISSAGSPAQATVAAGTSLLTSIANFFKPPVKATPMTAAMPGVYNAYGAQPSFLSQSSLLPGTPNSTVLFGAAAALILFAVIGGGKK